MAISTNITQQPTTGEPHAAGEPYIYGYSTTEATGDPEVIFVEVVVYVNATAVATKEVYPVSSSSGLSIFRIDISSDVMDQMGYDFQAEGAAGDVHCTNSEKTVYVEIEPWTQASATAAVSASGITDTSNTTHAVAARCHPREGNDLSDYINNTTTPGKLFHDFYDDSGAAIDQVTRLGDSAAIYFWNDPLAATGATEIKVQKYQDGVAGDVDYYTIQGGGYITGTILKGLFAFNCGPANINAIGTGDWNGSGITIDDKTDSYVVAVGRLLTGGTFQETHKPVTFYHDSKVPADYARYQWDNYRGGADTYYFYKESSDQIPTSSNFYKPASTTFSVSDYGRVKTKVNEREGFTLIAHDLENEKALWLSQIASATSVQEVDGNDRYEVFVPDRSLQTRRTDGLRIEWEIEAEYSQEKTTRRR